MGPINLYFSINHFPFPQRLQYRDSDAKGKGERGEALRCCRRPRGAEQDAHCSRALCAALLQGCQGCLLERGADLLKDKQEYIQTPCGGGNQRHSEEKLYTRT